MNNKTMQVIHTKNFNVLTWWKGQQTNFPAISKYVRSILCIPASSAPSERAFSTANRVVSSLRCRLSLRAKILTYLAANLNLAESDLEALDWNNDPQE